MGKSKCGILSQVTKLVSLAQGTNYFPKVRFKESYREKTKLI